MIKMIFDLLLNKKISRRNKARLIANPYLRKTYSEFKAQALATGVKMDDSQLLLIPGENTATTDFDAHYIYHPAWAARVLKKTNPEKHIDISSTLHFCTQLSAFIPTSFYDYRPAFLNLDNLASGRADLSNLSFEDNSIPSLSCMHTIEHIGLGRYGDPIDFNGDKIAMKELQRVLAYNGNLLFVTPVGVPAIKFNGHRVYSYEQVIASFPELTLIEFSLIPDNAIENGMINNADPQLVQQQSYGCGCFWFTKKQR